MPGMGGRTSDEVRQIVYDYEQVAYGRKTEWRIARGISRWDLHKMRHAVFDGDLDRGLVPRDGARMSVEGRSKQYAARKSDSGLSPRDRQIAEQAQRIEVLEAEVDRHKQVAAALGKAIGLLQHSGEQEPATDQDEQDSRP